LKMNISGPVAVAVLVIAALAIGGGLYMRYFHETKLTPEQSRELMQKGMARQREAQQARMRQMMGGRGGPGSGAPPTGAGPQAGQ